MPLIKSLYKALDEWRTIGLNTSEINEVENDYTGEYLYVLNKFLDSASSIVGSSGANLIIFYHPQMTMNSDGAIIDNTNKVALNTFQEACKTCNITFIDMTLDFVKLYEEENLLAHGFINTAVGTGHLNKYGHRVIAERLVEVIGGE